MIVEIYRQHQEPVLFTGVEDLIHHSTGSIILKTPSGEVRYVRSDYEYYTVWPERKSG